MTGGKKWSKLSQGPEKSVDHMFVDASAWQARIRNYLGNFTPDLVGGGGAAFF